MENYLRPPEGKIGDGQCLCYAKMDKLSYDNYYYYDGEIDVDTGNPHLTLTSSSPHPHPHLASPHPRLALPHPHLILPQTTPTTQPTALTARRTWTC